MLGAGEKYYETIGPCVASAIAHVVVLILANQPASEVRVKTENAIQVEIVDIREESERSAKELPKVASNEQEYTGKAREAVAPAPLPDTPPINKPEQIGNGWRRSVEVLSNAELSNSNPRTQKLAEKLGQLETGTMLVQLCNLEAILQISRSEQEYPTRGCHRLCDSGHRYEGRYDHCERRRFPKQREMVQSRLSMPRVRDRTKGSRFRIRNRVGYPKERLGVA